MGGVSVRHTVRAWRGRATRTTCAAGLATLAVVAIGAPARSADTPREISASVRQIEYTYASSDGQRCNWVQVIQVPDIKGAKDYRVTFDDRIVGKRELTSFYLQTDEGQKPPAGAFWFGVRSGAGPAPCEDHSADVSNVKATAVFTGPAPTTPTTPTTTPTTPPPAPLPPLPAPTPDKLTARLADAAPAVKGRARGEIVVTRGGQKFSITEAGGLQVGDRITTDRNTVLMIEFSIGGQVGVNANTTIEIVGERSVKDASPFSASRLVKKTASLWVKADAKRLSQPLEVQTSGGVTGIRG